MPCTAAVPPVVRTAPTEVMVRGTMVTGSSRTSVKEARRLRLIRAGFCEPRKRVWGVFWV